MSLDEKSPITNIKPEICEDDAMISADEEECDYPTESCSIDLHEHDYSLITSVWNFLNPDHLKLKDYLYENEPEDMHSGDEEDYSNNMDSLTNADENTNARKYPCQEAINYRQRIKYYITRSFWFTIRMVLKFLKLLRNVILLIYFLFILVANLPFATIKNLFQFLKCFTDSPSILYIPFNIIPAILKYFIMFLKRSFICRSRFDVKSCGISCVNRSNSSRLTNNNSNSCEMSECIKSRVFIFGFVAVSVSILVLFCHLNPTARVCKFHSVISTLRLKIIENSQTIFLLPGEQCMRAGRCCKGYLEGTFRWFSCLVTAPIRVLLSAWPRRSIENEPRVDGLHSIRNYLDKIFEDISQVKEDINYQDIMLFEIQSNFINLEQKVKDKANAIEKLKPKLEKSSQFIHKMKTDICIAMEQLKKIINVRNDAERMIETVRTEAQDSASLVKNSLHRLQTSVESDQQRMETQVGSLENILKNDQTKSGNRNQRILSRLQMEIDNVEAAQIEITKRLIPLNNLETKYAEMAESLQKEIRNKLNGEMIHHEQMSKRTEKMCAKKTNKLEKDLAKAKKLLTCFVNKTLVRGADELYIKVRDGISKALKEKTSELARITVEKAMSKQPKTYQNYQRTGKKIKTCGLLSHLFNLRNTNPICLKDEMDMINASLLCNTKTVQTFSNEEKLIKDSVDEIIEESLTLLTADDIGIADYALESSGGAVILEWSTPTYTGRAAFLSLFGFTFGKVIKSIRKIIQPGNLPGECWAFKGDNGYVVIRLARLIVVTAVTIDHTSRSLTPDGKIMSAPKRFNIYALSDFPDLTGIKLGEFEYDEYGDSIQTFHLTEMSPKTQYVQFNFLSNHGNEEYTCIYRLRVHGNYTRS